MEIDLYVFYMETYNIITQSFIKNNIVRYVCIKILMQYRNLLIYSYYSDEDICKIKSNLNFKNSSENTEGRGINKQNLRRKTYPPL